MNALRMVTGRAAGPAVERADAHANLANLAAIELYGSENSHEPDIADDPAADPEALTLCALMWSYHPGDNTTARYITSVLRADDFESATHQMIFTVIAELVAGGHPHDAASVLTALIRAGSGGEKDAPLRRRLTNIVTSGGDRAAASHYADAVLSQSYRRSFRAAALRMAQAAAEAPEDSLFDHLVDIGRAQRSAYNRLTAFRDHVSGPPPTRCLVPTDSTNCSMPVTSTATAC